MSAPDRAARPADGADLEIKQIEKRMWIAERGGHEDMEELLYLVQVDMPHLVELAKAARPAPAAAPTADKTVLLACIEQVEEWLSYRAAPGDVQDALRVVLAAAREAARGEGES